MREENESARSGREAYNFVRQLNTRETMAAVNLKWQNQQKKRTNMLRKIIIATLTLVLIATAIGVTQCAADETETGLIKFGAVPVTEVDEIDNHEFIYADPGMCWGITYLPDTRSWLVETITGDYTIEYVIPTVDWTGPKRCVRN